MHRRFWANGAAFICAYVVLDWISFLYEFSPHGFTPWNPQSGLSLAFLLRTAPISAIWLPVAALLADLVVRGWSASFGLAVSSALVLSAGYIGAAHLLRLRRDFDHSLSSLRDVMILFGAGMAAAVAVAVMYAGLYAAAGLFPWSDFTAAAFRHWVGDIIGIAVICPLLLRFLPQTAPSTRGPLDRREIAIQALSVPLVLWIVFHPQTDEFKFFYLLFLPVLWVSVRHGLDGAAIAIAATQLGLIASIQLRSFGPESAVEFQTLMLALAFTGLLIGAVVSERQRIQSALHESERRLRERQGELAQFARTSAVGEMASSLAHELSQPLAATSTYLSTCRSLLRSSVPDMATVREAIGKAEIQAQRAGRVLAGLRDFLYRGETHLGVSPASSLVQSVAGLSRAEVERLGAAMTVTDETGGALILIDQIQIEQALLNVIRNAAESLSETRAAGRQIGIRARADAETVLITVSDNGPGISVEIAERLFQPFVSTKARGMGLGLTISRSIVEAHGGTLRFEPRDGGGAVFHLQFPRASEP